MSKAVMISIRPEWCAKIANGEKTIEVRKTKPSSILPLKCYIYCTKRQTPALVNLQNLLETPRLMTAGSFSKKHELWDMDWARLCNGKVIGEFVCDRIETHDLPYPAYQSEVPSSLRTNACMSYTDLHRYVGSGNRFYGWHISDLVIYDTPKQLCDFSNSSSRLEFSNTEDGFPWRWSGMKRPPQSWCYVEAEEDE